MIRHSGRSVLILHHMSSKWFRLIRLSIRNIECLFFPPMLSNTQSFSPHWCNAVTILGTKYTYGKFLCRVCEFQIFFSVQSVSNATCRPTCCLGCSEDTVRVPASVLQWAVLVTPPNTLDPTVAYRLNTTLIQLLLCVALTTTSESTCLGEDDLNWSDNYHKIT
jgi:hypothetical protein